MMSTLLGPAGMAILQVRLAEARRPGLGVATYRSKRGLWTTVGRQITRRRQETSLDSSMQIGKKQY